MKEVVADEQVRVSLDYISDTRKRLILDSPLDQWNMSYIVYDPQSSLPLHRLWYVLEPWYLKMVGMCSQENSPGQHENVD